MQSVFFLHSTDAWSFSQGIETIVKTICRLNLICYRNLLGVCFRDAIENAGHLYNQVDELVHRLVMLSNKCTQELEFIMEFKTLEEGFREVRIKVLHSVHDSCF